VHILVTAGHTKVRPTQHYMCIYLLLQAVQKYCRFFLSQIVNLLLQDCIYLVLPRHILVVPIDTWSPVMQGWSSWAYSAGFHYKPRTCITWVQSVSSGGHLPSLFSDARQREKDYVLYFLFLREKNPTTCTYNDEWWNREFNSTWYLCL
jgi:hypothetical protein